MSVTVTGSTLGARLFEARKRAGLTREEAAVKAGRTGQTISRYEADATEPPESVRIRLASAYGVPLSELEQGPSAPHDQEVAAQ